MTDKLVGVYGSSMIDYIMGIIMATVHYNRATTITNKYIAYIHKTKTHTADG